jgi:hypothetical protein
MDEPLMKLRRVAELWAEFCAGTASAIVFDSETS